MKVLILSAIIKYHLNLEKTSYHGKIYILLLPGPGASFVGQPRPRDCQHAGQRQQGPGLGTLPRMRQGNIS